MIAENATVVVLEEAESRVVITPGTERVHVEFEYCEDEAWHYDGGASLRLEPLKLLIEALCKVRDEIGKGAPL